MCQHKHQQIYGESASCQCGCAEQTVWHLLWECPCYPPPLVTLEYRKHLPRFESVAHLLPEKAERADISLWRQSCHRAIKILSGNPILEPRVVRDADAKGHVVGVNLTGTYAYCRKCYITRRIRDKKWIWTRECRAREGQPRTLGETWEWEGHDVTLTMARWRVMAERPAMTRAKCHLQVWATAGFKEPCVAVDESVGVRLCGCIFMRCRT